MKNREKNNENIWKIETRMNNEKKRENKQWEKDEKEGKKTMKNDET